MGRDNVETRSNPCRSAEGSSLRSALAVWQAPRQPHWVFAPSVALAETRQYKLLRTRETRNTCTYCSVGCGLLMYSLGDGAKNAKASIFHIEGDPDHPVNRGALCPKGAGLVDFIHSESRLKFPEYRAPGSDKWQQISWEEAFDRIAKLMKEDRDANYIAQKRRRRDC